MIRLSPGILVSSHKMIKRIYEYEHFDVFNQSVKNQSIDGTKTSDVVDTIIACNWVEVIQGSARLSSRGIQIAKEFDSNIKRLMIGDYIRHASDPWISLIPRGRKECEPYLHQDVLACFKNEGLLATPPTDDVILWWDQQAQFVRKDVELTTLEIGRIGEKLTIAHERKRTKKEPVWKSIESNLAGYDILSILETGSTAQLSIEVKTSEKPIELAKAFITRHEWEVALNTRHYQFHFWSIKGGGNQIAVINPEDIEKHLPTDQGDGRWDLAEVAFSSFANLFQ